MGDKQDSDEALLGPPAVPFVAVLREGLRGLKINSGVTWRLGLNTNSGVSFLGLSPEDVGDEDRPGRDEGSRDTFGVMSICARGRRGHSNSRCTSGARGGVRCGARGDVQCRAGGAVGHPPHDQAGAPLKTLKMNLKIFNIQHQLIIMKTGKLSGKFLYSKKQHF